MPFYTNTLNATPYTLIRSAEANSQFALVQAGFELVEIETTAAFKAPDGEAPVTLPAAAERASKSFVFDANGAPAVATAATSAEMDAAVAAAVSAAADAATASAAAASVTGSANAINYLLIQQGVM